jgi:NAD(P)-dependent dehydrogenase (short-subunit alcohol dehydrogenase family)
MLPPKEILPSEVIIQRYGKTLEGKTSTNPSIPVQRSPPDRIVLITGVSGDSIAGELATQLSAADPRLLILSARDETKATPIINKIRATKPNVTTRFLNMDLGDLGSIKQAVYSLDDVPKLDHIVCVAGVMVPPYGKTRDGFESQFGVNYLANFALVRLLLPKVQVAGAIIIVASSAVRGGKINFADIGFSVCLFISHSYRGWC